ncbi:beta-propeller fold lactonase family protein, partial [Priestia sp. SIMBA_032]|uniref:beta-propeller fold lactonase family protein n=1 Tax=Priestia sp. SIMBA_032 TaxID=3085775 RepID=UPI003978ED31
EEGGLTLRPEATVVLGSAGPRHLAFHPDGAHAVLVNELDSSIDVLRRRLSELLVALAAVVDSEPDDAGRRTAALAAVRTS